VSSIRKALDSNLFADALRKPGIDPRHWVSYGTVGTVNDKGKPNFKDKSAILISTAGIDVDVILEPLNLLVTCRYSGVQGGCSATIISPIHVGDRVLVVLPDGDTSGPPVIQAILHNASCKMPMKDGEALFKNDRVLIYAVDDDIDIRTPGGARVQVKHSGNVITEGIDVTMKASSSALVEGQTAKLKAETIATVEAPATMLGEGGLNPFTDGVVVAQGVDPFTELTYGMLGNSSTVVMAKK
jgi:hypothetical protein